MRYKATRLIGVPFKPLLILFHGAMQSAERFAERTELLSWCEKQAWSFWAPQAPFKDWTRGLASSAQELVVQARLETERTGPLILCGFSDGGTMAHRCWSALSQLPEVYKALQPVGLWTHSSPFPKILAPSIGTSNTRVAVSCNTSETRRLPRLGFVWYSMQDYAEQACTWYRRIGLDCQQYYGTLDGHHWDPKLNQEVLERLAA